MKFENLLSLASGDELKQSVNIHSVYYQSTFLLISSWDQLDIGLLPIQIYNLILQLDNQVSSTYHMWKIMQYMHYHLPPLSLSFE